VNGRTIAVDVLEPGADVGSLVENAYGLIRRDIIFGRLEPGLKLRIDELRGRYGLGATPLREALARLSTGGLVESTSQRGFRVSRVSAADLEDVTESRVRLESELLRQSIEHGDDAWEARVAGAFHSLAKMESQGLPLDAETFSTWERRNRAFHEALVAACRSQWTLRFRSLIYDQHERYRRISHANASPARARDAMRDHAAIKDAALARDADRACALTEVHILRTLETVRTKVAAAGFFGNR